jgi:hypothetical protein
MTVIGLAFTLAALAPAPIGSSSRLAMRVSPTMASAPARLWVYTRVERDARHRAIEIVAESEEFFRSSEIELDGDRAPRTAVFEFRGLPAGLYDVRAVLKGEGGREIEVAAASVTLFESMRNDR